MDSDGKNQILLSEEIYAPISSIYSQSGFFIIDLDNNEEGILTLKKFLENPNIKLKFSENIIILNF